MRFSDWISDVCSSDLGVATGDHIAVLLENRPEFFDVVGAGLRIGAYVTPINWHLTAREAAFIVADCGAQVLFASAELTSLMDDLDAPELRRRISVGGHVEGLDDLDALIAEQPSSSPTEQSEGAGMFYSPGPPRQPKWNKPPTTGGEL